jgi:hypothetical protein
VIKSLPAVTSGNSTNIICQQALRWAGHSPCPTGDKQPERAATTRLSAKTGWPPPRLIAPPGRYEDGTSGASLAGLDAWSPLAGVSWERIAGRPVLGEPDCRVGWGVRWLSFDLVAAELHGSPGREDRGRDRAGVGALPQDGSVLRPVGFQKSAAAVTWVDETTARS